jgi:predicted dehydrogenase
MPVNNLSARPHQEAVPHNGNVHRATHSPRSVILVGAGRRGLGAHLPALGDCGYLRLTAIVDTAERIAQLSENPALTVPMYDSLAPVLAGPGLRPDLAIVATPHDSHVPLAGELLEARVPTLLEKPPARNARELVRLLDLSHKLRTPLATSLPLHYRASYQPFIELLRAPGLTDAEVRISASVPSWRGAGSWRLSRERAGGGVLIDLGYHYLELLVACLEPPAHMSAVLTNAAGNPSEVEGEALVTLWFARRRLRVELSLRSWPDSPRHSELSITRAGALLHHTGAAAPAPGGSRPSLGAASTPAAAQLQTLVTSGFLDGGGDWYQTLGRQYLVMQLLDDLYASAHRMACPPAIAGQPDMACPADRTGLPERTPA